MERKFAFTYKEEGSLSEMSPFATKEETIIAMKKMFTDMTGEAIPSKGSNTFWIKNGSVFGFDTKDESWAFVKFPNGKICYWSVDEILDAYVDVEEPPTKKEIIEWILEDENIIKSFNSKFNIQLKQEDGVPSSLAYDNSYTVIRISNNNIEELATFLSWDAAIDCLKVDFAKIADIFPHSFFTGKLCDNNGYQGYDFVEGWAYYNYDKSIRWQIILG